MKKHNLVGKIYLGDDLTWRSQEILKDTRVGYCDICGFYHAEPYPDPEFLSKYYSSYIIPNPLHQEERDRIGRLLKMIIKPANSIIDIGCGKGELLNTLANIGFKHLYGTEYGHMRKEALKNKSITIMPFDIEGIAKWCCNERKVFDCAILINVIEHVPEPIELLIKMKEVISQTGTLLFSIPNDFNVLQTLYLDKTRRKPWFLVLPDHINFISLSTIDNVMKKAGYEIIHKTVQYPLEMFLLQGDDYVARPEIGKECHSKRVEFEKSFSSQGKAEDLERIYDGFAKLGIGRDMYILAKPIK